MMLSICMKSDVHVRSLFGETFSWLYIVFPWNLWSVFFACKATLFNDHLVEKHHTNAVLKKTDQWAAKRGHKDFIAWELWQLSDYLCLERQPLVLISCNFLFLYTDITPHKTKAITKAKGRWRDLFLSSQIKGKVPWLTADTYSQE